jgi:hypothetical protein
MATLGELVAKLSLDIGQFTNALQRVEQEVKATKSEISKSFKDLGGEVAGHFAKMFALTAVVEKFGEAFSEAIDHAAELQELGAALDTPVSALDELTLALKLSGTSMESFSKQMKTLNAEIVQASNPTSKAAELFKALGVEITDVNGKARLGTDVYKDVIAQLAQIEDPALRSATAQKLLGKSATDALKAAKELAENLEIARHQIEVFGGSNDEAAKRAKDFKDKLDLLHDGSQRMMNKVVEGVLPALSGLLDAFGKTSESGGSVASVLGEVLGGALRVFGTALVVTVTFVKNLALGMAGLVAVAVTLATQGFSAANKVLEDMQRQMNENSKAAAESIKSIWGLGEQHVKTAEATQKHAVDAKTLQQNLSGQKDESNKAADALAKIREQLDNVGRAQAEGRSEQTIKLLDLLNTNWLKLGYSVEQYAEKYKLILSLDPAAIAGQKALADSLAALSAVYTKGVTDAEKMYDSLIDQRDAAREAGAAFGKTGDQLADLTANKMKRAIDALENASEEYKALLKSIVDATTAQLKFNNSLATSAQYNKLVEALDEERSALGLVGREREKYIAQMRLNNVLTSDASDEAKAEAIRLYEVADALGDARQATADYNETVKANADLLKTAEGYGQSFVESFGEGMKGVSDWAKRVGADLKKYLLDVLYQLTVKKWIVSLVGSMTGGVGDAVGGAVGQTGGSMLSSLFSSGASTAGGWLASLFSSGAGVAGGFTAASTIGAGTAASFGAGAAGLGTSALATSLAGGAGGVAAGSFGAAAGGGMAASFGAATGGASALATEMAVTTTATATLGASMVAMIPVIGAIIAVAYIAYTLLAQAQGGAKEGGFATTGIREEDVPGGRYYTPDHADSDIKQLTDALADSYKQAVEGLGGTARSDLGFAFGFDTDPQGTAQSRVSAGVYGAGGEEIFKQLNVDAGRDDESLQAAIGTESKRALLAALQASELPQEIADILDVVVASTASDADVDNIIATAGALHQLVETIAAMDDPLGDATDAWELANQTALEGWNRQREALKKFADDTPTTAQGIVDLTTNIQGMYVATVNLLTGIMKAKAGMDEMFGNTRDTIEKAALTPDQLYEREQKKARDLFTKLQNATDPDEILRISEQLNQSINSAFSMLTPEEQKAKSKEFLDGLDKVQKEADKRLDASMKKIADDAKTDRDFYTTKIKDITDAVKASADTFNTGATRVANMRDHNVNIHVQDDRIATEVTYGGDYGGGGGDSGGQ